MWKIFRTVGTLGSKGCFTSKFPKLAFFRSRSSHEKTITSELPRGFEVVDLKDVPEYDMRIWTIAHNRTGALFYHFDRDDNHSAFSVQFRTVPRDSTGVAHILEHMVLCGSKNFPCSEPFFKMLTRSMATFMNAMTGPDVTLYPFSTQNFKDFENLLRIYLDAVFFPNLEYLDFRQEGWRLDVAKNNQSGQQNTKRDLVPKPKGLEDIEFQGVVYNEMKGAMSQLPSLVDRHVRGLLLPSFTYSNNYGGEPINIIDLTYKQLQEFHSTFYHPSNAKFLLYGNYPVSDWLQLIDQNVLQHHDKKNIDSFVPSEARWSEAKTVVLKYQEPSVEQSNPELSRKQSIVLSSFLIGDITDIYSVYCWNILSYLLISGPSSPFHKGLIQSGLGGDFSPATGFESDVKDCYFSVGAQLVDNENTNALIEAIDTTIDKVIVDGFPEERINSVLHQIELNLKHQKSNFGLDFVMGTTSKLNHDCNLAQFYSVSEVIDKFKTDMTNDPKFLSKLIVSGLRKNTHRLNLIMKPDKEYSQQQRDREVLKLSEILESLDQTSRNDIFTESSSLLEKQNFIPDASCLPRLAISDIEPKIQTYQSELITGHKLCPPTLINVQPTNGICYFHALFSIDALTEDEKQFLPIFASVITRLGADGLNFEQLRNEIDNNSGGFSVSVNVSPHPQNLNLFEQTLQISSYALIPKVQRMFELWGKILTRPDYEAKEYLQVMLKERSQRLFVSLEHAAHRYAMRSASCALSAPSYYSEIYAGMSQVLFSRYIANELDLDKYMNIFQGILRKIANASNSRCSLNLPTGQQEQCLDSMSTLFDSLNLEKQALPRDKFLFAWRDTPLEQLVAKYPLKMRFNFPFQVSYAARSLPTAAYSHEDSARLAVLSKLLSWNYLHQEIREKGGAYGGGSTTSSNGNLSFFSYRDPTPYLSQKTFLNSLNWLRSANIDQQMIDGAKLNVFQESDAPVAPGLKNLTHFLTGFDTKLRQAKRDRVFAVNRDEILEVADKYFSDEVLKKSRATVIGPETEEAMKYNWPVVNTGM